MRWQLELLGDSYAGSPVLRALVRLVPYALPYVGPAAEALETLLVNKLNQIRSERLRAFFDELGAGEVLLTEELIQSEDFLHKYFATLRAALDTRRREKIRVFARMLVASHRHGSFADTDEYEEFLGIVDELSFPELQLLALMAQQGKGFAVEDTENDMEGEEGQKQKKATEAIGMNRKELVLRLQRLVRTGLVGIAVGSRFAVGSMKLTMTDRFWQLMAMVGSEFLAARKAAT
jgi:hypothetical protein